MRKELLIFGAYGALGQGAIKSLIKNKYDKIYLFGSYASKRKKFEIDNAVNIDTEDLSVEANVIKAFKFINSSKDKLLFLFSTIGGFTGGKYIWETEETEWDKMIEINLKINFFLAKHFASLVKDSAGGSICFTSAYTGLHPESKKGAYGVSKSALLHLVKTLAIEGKEIKLSANAIAPYIIDTPDNRKWMPDADFLKWIKPEEIGELVDSIFDNYSYLSGNIVELKDRIDNNGIR